MTLETTNRLDKDHRTQALLAMVKIRQAEEEIQNLFLANLVRGTTHLAVGQEACSAGVALALSEGDTMTCTYRGHGHALALGMSLRSLMAEMMGKESGACKGRGGSMHMTDKSIGLLGANAVVGAQLPIAMGAALTAQVKRTGAIAVTFFGDGAANIGLCHESMNMASVWKLPVLFICENNLYGEYSHIRETTPIDDIADRAAAYGMPGVIVDGQDVEAVHARTKSAAERARNGEGPTLLELKTYRYGGHSRSDTGPYRKPGELAQWQSRDPIDILTARMFADGQLDQDEFNEIKDAIAQEVFDAVEWAKAEPFPSLQSLDDYVYASG
ncbi:MAG: thiamine pyrophosphate-dependent dehydrogenase E1 component subunit alpha [Chloroflexi bacterium]|nr:thiamine pyrophosphate-dependent dehydrogenase E1 component subunit alpha [Chloroflexota bacterium]